MSFFETMMRLAAPVLFWIAILLFVFGFATPLAVEVPQFGDLGGSAISIATVISALYQGLSSAVWPFMGAAIVWNLQRRVGGGSQ